MGDNRLRILLEISTRAKEGGDPRWLQVEETLGLELPPSYKQLVDAFGASCWCDFLHVLSPFDHNPNLNLQARGMQQLNADRVLRQSFPSHYPIPLYPEVGGIMPWAITDNGDALYFITAGPANHWPTMIHDARAPEFEVNFLPPALLIHHFAAGTLQSTILPILPPPDAEGKQ